MSEAEPTRVTPNVTEVDEAVAGEVVEALSRREELRARAAGALSGRLTTTDVAVLVGIGLLGALPTTPSDGLPGGVREVIGHGVTLRDLVISQLGVGGGAGPALGGVIQNLGMGGGVGGFAALLAAAPGSAPALLPDFEDMFESVGTKILTDWWCGRQGWKDGEQVFHEAKALAYAVTAIGGAALNPDPIAFGLAGWHMYKAFEASRSLTKDLVELAAIAIRDGRRAMDALDHEVHRSLGVDRAVQSSLSKTPRFGEDDDGFLDAFGPDAGRGLS
ncbi:MAG: hypothetical protein KA978_18375 [Deltaproteobacteria bacterium]|jgi:hypothetical protein|nr:hypothetical protein [Deltaproteobacteria bacterium]